MKKSIVIIALAMSIISCNDKSSTASTSKEFKTAYIDTAKLLTDYTEAKDLEAKYKAKSEEEQKKLEAEVNRFKSEYANFEKVARANGQAWAEQNGQALMQKRDQLQYAQQAIGQKLQMENATERDTMLNVIKKFIKEYSKKEGYDYVFGTEDVGSILYAQEKYDITKDVIKLLNDKYAGNKDAKTETKTETKTEAKK